MIINNLGGNEAALKIAVDNTGGLRRGGALRDGPGPDFFFAGRQVTLQAQGVVGGVDQLDQAGFFLAVAVQ